MGDPLLLALRCLAACSSTMMILSPARAVWRIHKNHDTGFTSIISLVMTLANCHAWLLFGLVTSNIFPIVVTFAIGDVISLIYICVYWRWTAERAYVQRAIAIVSAFLVLASTYAALGGTGVTHQSRNTVKAIVGSIAIVVALALYSSPLERVMQVLKHKSAVFIPVDMVIAGSVNNALWLAYAALDSNWFLLVPNAIFLTVGITSLILYLIYHPKRCPYPKDEQESSRSITIVLSPKEAAAVRGSRGHIAVSPSFQLLQSPHA